jgi:hypothetical protein
VLKPWHAQTPPELSLHHSKTRIFPFLQIQARDLLF